MVSFSLQELDYEGALRFYFESGKQELTKAVQVTNTTNVKELLPILTEKFNLRKDLSQCVLYVVHEAGTAHFFVGLSG